MSAITTKDGTDAWEDQMLFLGARGFRCSMCSTHKDQINADLLAFFKA